MWKYYSKKRKSFSDNFCRRKKTEKNSHNEITQIRMTWTIKESAEEMLQKVRNTTQQNMNKQEKHQCKNSWIESEEEKESRNLQIEVDEEKESRNLQIEVDEEKDQDCNNT